jgi:hypothetical protein
LRGVVDGNLGTIQGPKESEAIAAIATDDSILASDGGKFF